MLFRTTFLRYASNPSLSCSFSTLNARLHAQRNAWATTTKNEDEIIFQRSDALGDSLSVNFTLNNYAIAPKDEAYRNLHLRGLRTLCSASGPNQSNQISEKNESVPVYTVNDATSLLRHVRKHLSSTQRIFVRDGAVGSAAPAEFRTRIISDTAESDLALSNLLFKLPQSVIGEGISGPSAEFPTGFVLASTTSLPVSVTEALERVGVKGTEGSNGFVVVDAKTQNFYAVGSYTTGVVSVLSSLAAQQLALNGVGVTLRGSVLLSKTGEVVLALGGDAEDPLASSLGEFVVGAGHFVWTKDGVFRLWNGVQSRSPSSASFGSLVETLPKGVRVTKEVKASQNKFNSPVAVVLLKNNAEGKKLSQFEPTLLNQFLVATDTSAEASQKLLGELVSGTKASAHELSSSSLTKLLNL